MTERLTAAERVAALTSAFEEKDAGLAGRDPLGFEGYQDQLDEARTRTGSGEAVIWGWATIGGQRCALVAGDFSFLGGSMGVAAGEKVARAFDAARRGRMPVVCATASGGARMQEGMWSLVQMAKTVEARRRHAAAGLVQVSLLTSPTTGGVYASFASLADVILAEPEATVGFAGPRVVEEMTGELPPAEVHTAEFAFAHGLVDALVPREEQAKVIANALFVLGGAPRALEARAAPPQTPPRSGTSQTPPHSGTSTQTHPQSPPSAWDRLQAARDPAHPKGHQLLQALLSEPVYLRGDRTGAPDDEHVVAAAGGLRGTTRNVVVVAQNATGDGRIRPQGFRKAIRAIEIAGRLGLPLVTLIDTRGADPLGASEGGGVAAAIARTFEALLACRSPTVSVLTGEGGSGGALAMATADRVLAWENSVFSVIAPEAAAAILYRDSSRGPELAERLRITTADLVALGLVDAVVPRPSGVEGLVAAVGAEVDRTSATRRSTRLRRRAQRWRRIASP